MRKIHFGTLRIGKSDWARRRFLELSEGYSLEDARNTLQLWESMFPRARQWGNPESFSAASRVTPQAPPEASA